VHNNFVISYCYKESEEEICTLTSEGDDIEGIGFPVQESIYILTIK